MNRVAFAGAMLTGLPCLMLSGRFWVKSARKWRFFGPFPLLGDFFRVEERVETLRSWERGSERVLFLRIATYLLTAQIHLTNGRD